MAKTAKNMQNLEVLNLKLLERLTNILAWFYSHWSWSSRYSDKECTSISRTYRSITLVQVPPLKQTQWADEVTVGRISDHCVAAGNLKRTSFVRF